MALTPEVRSINRRSLAGHAPGTLGDFLSMRDDWETPPDLFDEYNRLHRFNLDPCANAHNAVHTTYIERELNGLSVNWRDHVVGREVPRVWMHPPHSEPALWSRKAVLESRRGALVVALLPARTGDGWWHEFVMRYAARVVFLRGTPAFRLHRLPMVSTVAGQEYAIGAANRPLPTGGFAIVVYTPTNSENAKRKRSQRT